jgi:hypothetical protein
MFAALTGIGLSAAAGLNAYIPFLVVALVARFTDLMELPASMDWISSWWAIGAAGVLLLSELVLDKIAVVDHINDLVATLIRPTVGGLIFAASSAAEDIDKSSWMAEHPWVGVVVGVVVSGLVHAGKTSLRPAVNVTTGGLGTPIVSAAEDTTSFGLSMLAIFLPVLVILALVVMGVAAFWLFRHVRRLRRGRRPVSV